MELKPSCGAQQSQEALMRNPAMEGHPFITSHVSLTSG